MHNMIVINYSSGIGNSLVVARNVGQLVNANLIPIASLLPRDSVQVKTNAFGIVFPAYYETCGGVPLIVTKFIRKLTNVSGKFIFSICTYGSGSIVTLNNIDKALKLVGGKLSACISRKIVVSIKTHWYSRIEVYKNKALKYLQKGS
jgi:hypothetical protein